MNSDDEGYDVNYSDDDENYDDVEMYANGPNSYTSKRQPDNTIENLLSRQKA